MTAGELAGYVASVLVFMTFYMKTMIPLRIVGILSNIAFLTYGYIEGLLPVVILHVSLLPLKFHAIAQSSRLIGKTREAAGGELSFEALLPFMHSRGVKAGEVLFREGDVSREMYYIAQGAVRLPELDKTIGQGELLGEVSLFAPDKARTVSALCETDGELLVLTEENVLQLYNQNPRFGFYLLRIITGRLVENYRDLVRRGGLAPAGDRSAVSTNGSLESQINKLDEKRPEPSFPPVRPRAVRRLLGRYLPMILVMAFFGLLLASWSLAPYLQSLIARDAAVTTWSNIATAPIDGTVSFADLSLHNPVAADGTVAEVLNDRLPRQAFEEAGFRVSVVRARVKELELFLEEIKSLNSDRGDVKSHYADLFRDQLDLRLVNLGREIAIAEKQLDLMRKIAAREDRLASRGAVSQNDADEANLRAAQLEGELERLISDLRYTRLRRKAADRGIFITSSGTDPDWVLDSRMELKLERKEARLELKRAQAELAAAETAFALAAEDLERQSKATVKLPPGSIVWSRMAAPGSTVRAGDPLVEWLNCDILFVEVPLPDIELPLLRPGMEAKVILDGGEEALLGKVLLTRGAASTLARTDLVAIAKGRDAHNAQVLIDLSDQRATFEGCPVGRSAFVDFPDIGILEIIAVWLRI